jgi:hypothetical protein
MVLVSKSKVSSNSSVLNVRFLNFHINQRQEPQIQSISNHESLRLPPIAKKQY